VRAESTVGMVILTMNISGYRAAKCHKLGARHNGGEPTPRQKGLDDFRQADAGLCF
jgi:hypothetical protein